jgi:hypothetical protein
MQMLAIVALAVILPPSLSAAQVQSTTGEFPELKDMPFSDRLRRIDERPEPGRSSPSDSTDFPRLDDRLPTNPDEMAPDESRSLPPQPTDLPPDAPAGIDRSHIDWTVQRVSAVDLEVGREWRFEHGSATMTPAEESDYADLIRLALNRRRLITAGIPDDVGAESAWQSAFYRYEQVRRQAWAQGNLTLSGRVTLQQDPFFGPERNPRLTPRPELHCPRSGSLLTAAGHAHASGRIYRASRCTVRNLHALGRGASGSQRGPRG